MSQDQPLIWEKQLRWTCKLGGAESLGIFRQTLGANSVHQVDKVSDMAPASWLCGSVGEGVKKGKWPLLSFLSGKKLSCSFSFYARYFSSSLCATGAFKLLL